MTTFQTPGIFIEGSPAPLVTIPGLPTDIALFAGVTVATATGENPLPPVTSLEDFDRVCGRPDPAASTPAAVLLRLAARAFFANGGTTLRIASVSAIDPAAIADALQRSVGLRDVAMVAAPGLAAVAGADPLGIARALIAHVGTAGSRRFAIIDPPPGLGLGAIQAWRALLDSPDAALYHPCIVAPDDAGRQLAQTPSGFVAGIFARVDRARGVFKPPANETVTGATGLVARLNAVQQQLLNPLGINCIAAFPGRGIRVWGARTLSVDPEARYVSIRRLLRWLEASIADGLGWAVFEPNAEPTWAKVRDVVTAFLFAQWRAGALTGAKPEQAFFVRCDRTTMTQSDLDAGLLVCQIGIASVTPSEFAIFRVRTSAAG